MGKADKRPVQSQVGGWPDRGDSAYSPLGCRDPQRTRFRGLRRGGLQSLPRSHGGTGLTKARLPAIGVLAIQGDYAAHAEALVEAGAEPCEVRKPEQLAGLDGL